MTDTGWLQWMQDTHEMAELKTTDCPAILRLTLRLLAQAAEALEAVEWVRVPIGMGASEYMCPWCYNTKPQDHAPDCRRETTLSRIRAGGAE